MSTPTPTYPSPIEGEQCIELSPGVWMTTGDVSLPCGPSYDPTPVQIIDPETGQTPSVPSTQTTVVVAVAEPPVPAAQNELDVVGAIMIALSSFLRWI